MWSERRKIRCRCTCATRPTGLMKGLGYGEGYQYAHDLESKVADMQCLPDNLKHRVVLPSDRRGNREAHQGATGRDSEGENDFTTEARRHRGKAEDKNRFMVGNCLRRSSTP